MVQHGHRRRPVPLLPQLAGRPEHPLRVADRPHRRAARRPARSSGRRRRSRRERDRLAQEYAALLDEDARRTFSRPAGPLADGVPVRRGAQVLLRLLVPDPLVEQDPRVRGAARRATASSRTARTSSSSRATRCSRRSTSSCCTWATGGQPLGPAALAADRRAAQGAARQARRLDAAAGAGRGARGDDRPDDGHALGRDHRARARVGAPAGRRHDAQRRGGLAGHGRGARARGPLDGRRSATCATARSSCAAARRRRGRRSSRRSGRRSPTSAASCPTPRSSAASTACRRSSAPAARRRRSSTGQLIRVDGTAGVVTVLEPDGARRWATHTRALDELRAERRAALRRQEREPRRAARAPASRCRPGSRSPPARSGTFMSPAGPRRRRRPGAGARHGRRRGCARRRRPRDRRGDAARRRSRTPCATRSPAGTPRWPRRPASGAAGGGALERRRRGQRGGHLRRPAGDLSCGCAGADDVCDAVRDCWASLYSAPAISYRARLGHAARAGDGRDRAADGRRRGLRA